MSASGRLLVTGGAGFIGRRCLPGLAAVGLELHCISSRSRASDELGGGTWHRYDLLDIEQCRDAVDAIRPTHLLHLAWITTPGAFWTSRDNLRWLAGSTALFDAFFAHGGKRALGLGTCAEYPWNGNGEYAEAAAMPDPGTLYGQCKAAAWRACQAAAARHGGQAQAVWARLFYPYGPGEPAERLIPSVIKGLLQGRTVDCTLGTQIRDFIYVDDVADALLALLRSRLAGAYNLGTGQRTPVREVVNLIGSALGRAELIKFGARPSPPGDPACIVADVAKLTTDLNWRPGVSLQRGIDDTIRSWRKELSQCA
jgi:nucleoside-diphosphate-sugar epimerase